MDPVSALQEHAAGTPDATGVGFADRVWRCRQHDEPLVLEPVWESLVSCFQALTAESRTWSESGVPLAVAYPVSEVIAAGLALGVEHGAAVNAFVWRVATAWEAVLAGDVEDVVAHVRDEALARGVPALAG